MTLTQRELLAERPDEATEDVHFPERLVERVIAEYSAVGDLVLDPFAGFGTTPAVALRMRRRAIAIELLPERADAIRRRATGDEAHVIVGDARELLRIVADPVDLCFTSPPYMTRTGHPENPLTGYRTRDATYDGYLDDLESVFRSVAVLLRPGGHLVINVANTIGSDGITPLADDLTSRVSHHLALRRVLPLAWDKAPPGLVDDRCVVFEKQQ